MKRKRRVSKKVRILITILIVLVLIVVGYLVLKPSKSKKVQNVVQIEETIDSHGYELADNETNYYKDLFKNLKKVLNETPLDEEKYASLVSQLFLADFFTLDNKISKNDVGGLQFIYSDFQGDFEKYAKESVYRYIENNAYGDRKQELPVVTEVEIVSIEQMEIFYLDTKDTEAYQIELKISYEKDLDYQTTATLYLVHHNDKLEIVKMAK